MPVETRPRGSSAQGMSAGTITSATPLQLPGLISNFGTKSSRMAEKCFLRCARRRLEASCHVLESGGHSRDLLERSKQRGFFHALRRPGWPRDVAHPHTTPGRSRPKPCLCARRWKELEFEGSAEGLNNMKIMAEVGAAPSVISAMDAHGSQPGIQEDACHALATLSHRRCTKSSSLSHLAPHTAWRLGASMLLTISKAAQRP